MALVSSAFLVLNELSLPRSAEEVEEAIVTIFALLKKAREARSDVDIVSPVGLNSHVLDSGQSFAGVALEMGGLSRDAWRYVVLSRDRAPLRTTDLKGGPSLFEEYLFDGVPSIGLGYAHVLEQVGVSASEQEPWDSSWLIVERRRLEEADGEVDMVVDKVEVRHASMIAHIDEHSAHLRSRGAGSEIWRDRVARFPMLEFLPGVEAQLEAIGAGSAASLQIDKRLTELNEAIADWEPAAGSQPVWGSHVTPESASRRKYCMFEDLDGVVRCFDMHSRFTPDAGRIHFRLVVDGTKASVRVAYIGRKLGI